MTVFAWIKLIDIYVYACILVVMKNFEHCLNFEIRKANRVLSQVYDGYLQGCGLKTSQFSVLRAICFLNNKTTNTELQKILVLDQTSLSRALKPLLRDGIIQATTGVDRRQKELSLTTKGLDVYDQALSLWEQAQDYVSTRLGEKGQHELLKTVQSIVSLKS